MAMRRPTGQTVEAFVEAVRKSNVRFDRVDAERLELIVGLVLALIAENLSFHREGLITAVKEQLRKRKWSWWQIWVVANIIEMAVDLIVDWLNSFDEPYMAVTLKLPPVDDLPELL